MLRLEPDRIDPARPLNTLGLDSLMAIELKGGVEADLGTILPLTSLMTGSDHRRARRPGDRPRRRPLLPLRGSDFARTPAARRSPSIRSSFGQQSLWHLHRLDPSSTAYNIAGAARVPAEVDVEVLRRSLQRLVDRHASLRTTFAEVDGRPVQRVHEASTSRSGSRTSRPGTRPHVHQPAGRGGRPPVRPRDRPALPDRPVFAVAPRALPPPGGPSYRQRLLGGRRACCTSSA